MASSGYPADALGWLCRLIGYQTVSHQSNLKLIHDIKDYLHALGVEGSLSINQAGDKANLVASIYNHNQPIAGGIVLSGHTDVVPVAGQAWSQDPFMAWVSGGKVFGRGACDMKGFVACCLAFLPKAVERARQGRLTTPLHLALSFDEEIGCLGVPLLIDDLKKHASPSFCLVGEPTNMQVVTAHKGICVYECHIKGKAVHSSLTPKGVNAISYAARLIAYIDELAQRQTSHSEDGFDVPFATLSVGQITGGIANNIVPQACRFSFEYRYLPTQDPRHVLDKISAKIAHLNQLMQAIDPDSGITLTQLNDVPALGDDCNHAFAIQVQALVGGDITKVAYATEAGHFARAGMATIICGPGCIDQAHKADEYVTCDQLQACEALFGRLFY